jgi:RNA polymerase sigma-70 factor (ECF subfamily)
MARLVEAAISNLPDQDCEIIIMRHYEQLSNQEVAQALSLSEPAASMRYLRALRRLKELIVNPASQFEDE